MISTESEDSELYKARELETERPVTEVRYRCYKYRLVQCLFEE